MGNVKEARKIIRVKIGEENKSGNKNGKVKKELNGYCSTTNVFNQVHILLIFYLAINSAMFL